MSGALVGKVASAFSSSATQHGGNETTLITAIPLFLHHGMVYVGLPYACQAQMGLDEIKGGSPYGATTIAGGQGERQPSEQELGMARWQGRPVAGIAQRLKG
jgi:NAD(P)H dehydrogenase (quinone)